MTDEGEVTFEAMARQFPGRTAVYTLGPPLVGLAQLANSYLHGVSLLYAGLFTLLLVSLSIVLTRYHLATFRVARITDEWLENPPAGGTSWGSND